MEATHAGRESQGSELVEWAETHLLWIVPTAVLWLPVIAAIYVLYLR